MSNLMRLLPNYYRSSIVMQAVLNAFEAECNKLSADAVDTENQFFVILSDRELQRYEQDLGLAVENNLSVEARRGRILSRLRGTGTVTKEMIRNVANSFVNGEIDIIEQPSDYTFIVKFISKKGVPPRIDDVKNAIEMIKPAHLTVEYIFTYRTWQEVLNLIADWQEAKSYSWDSLMTFDSEILNKLYIENDLVYFRAEGGGNAFIFYYNGKPYARMVN
jgi:hypothetical protein